MHVRFVYELAGSMFYPAGNYVQDDSTKTGGSAGESYPAEGGGIQPPGSQTYLSRAQQLHKNNIDLFLGCAVPTN
jgi:hypothetical protein